MKKGIDQDLRNVLVRQGIVEVRDEYVSQDHDCGDMKARIKLLELTLARLIDHLDLETDNRGEPVLILKKRISRLDTVASGQCAATG